MDDKIVWLIYYSLNIKLQHIKNAYCLKYMFKLLFLKISGLTFLNASSFQVKELLIQPSTFSKTNIIKINQIRSAKLCNNTRRKVVLHPRGPLEKRVFLLNLYLLKKHVKATVRNVKYNILNITTCC